VQLELPEEQSAEITEIDREAEILAEALASPPELIGGSEVQTTEVSARPRDASFSITVKRLYDYRCAICDVGLVAPDGKPEVQAAHIYPKRLDGKDDVRNGICLCRMHHWALDVGWIAIKDDHTILINDRVPRTDEYLFIHGWEGSRIRLPEDELAAPHPIYLLEHRRLMGFE
jgi:putative restriction endonuclease